MATYVYLEKSLLREYILMKRPKESPALYFSYHMQTGAWIISFGIPVENAETWFGVRIPYASEEEVDKKLKLLMDEIGQALDQHNLPYRMIP